jgi:hypothetical protein
VRSTSKNFLCRLKKKLMDAYCEPPPSISKKNKIFGLPNTNFWFCQYLLKRDTISCQYLEFCGGPRDTRKIQPARRTAPNKLIILQKLVNWRFCQSLLLNFVSPHKWSQMYHNMFICDSYSPHPYFPYPMTDLHTVAKTDLCKVVNYRFCQFHHVKL